MKFNGRVTVELTTASGKRSTFQKNNTVTDLGKALLLAGGLSELFNNTNAMDTQVIAQAPFTSDVLTLMSNIPVRNKSSAGVARNSLLNLSTQQLNSKASNLPVKDSQLTGFANSAVSGTQDKQGNRQPLMRVSSAGRIGGKYVYGNNIAGRISHIAMLIPAHTVQTYVTPIDLSTCTLGNGVCPGEINNIAPGCFVYFYDDADSKRHYLAVDRLTCKISEITIPDGSIPTFYTGVDWVEIGNYMIGVRDNTVSNIAIVYKIDKNTGALSTNTKSLASNSAIGIVCINDIFYMHTNNGTTCTGFWRLDVSASDIFAEDLTSQVANYISSDWRVSGNTYLLMTQNNYDGGYINTAKVVSTNRGNYYIAADLLKAPSDADNQTVYGSMRENYDSTNWGNTILMCGAIIEGQHSEEFNTSSKPSTADSLVDYTYAYAYIAQYVGNTGGYKISPLGQHGNLVSFLTLDEPINKTESDQLTVTYEYILEED